MIKSILCELLGIEYPIIQGGMAWVSDAHLAAAVSNAGGMGVIAAMSSNKSQIKLEIVKARELTDKDFAVNIMLMSPFADEVAEQVIDSGIKYVITGAGNPAKYMKEWTKAGIKVFPVVPSCGVARLVERAGACAVIAEGCEAGGHIGEIATMALIPQIVDAVSIPVIAAGGIADGRGLAAAFMLGACGIQVGTRFAAASECTISQVYKDKIIKAKDIDTIVSGRSFGHPVRALKSPFSREFLEREKDAAFSLEQMEAYGAGALRLAAREGDELKGCFMAGQSCGLVKKEQSCKEIIEDIFSAGEQILRNASALIS